MSARIEVDVTAAPLLNLICFVACMSLLVALRDVRSPHSQTHLNKVARQLNERPRKTLTFETPAERFNACVASTG
jgi:hypothetical protein